MPAALQNLGSKGLRGKIFHCKELAAAVRRLDWAAILLRHFATWAASRTVPVWAFCILSQGYSSQNSGMFLWTAVEKGRGVQRKRRGGPYMHTQSRVPPLQRTHGWGTLCGNGSHKHHEGWATRPTCIGCDMKVVSGDPDPKHVSTPYVERSNLTLRMGMRRFTRLTNAFSKKVENHRHMVALFFLYYNFCRVHSTLRATPAMEAGISNHVWTIEELCGLLPETASATKRIDKGLILKALGEQAS